MLGERQDSWTFDVTDASFEADVLRGSVERPVLVDFWAPWCGPCRTLGPLLERLAAQHGGDFALAKLNVDENPQTASAFGIQSIPAVKAFRQGELVDEFVGALPEASLQEFLRRILPSEADRVSVDARQAEAQGDVGRAELLYRRVLELDPRHPSGHLGIGRLIAPIDRDGALAAFERVSPGTPERQEADRLAARLRISGQDVGRERELRDRLAEDPSDLGARARLAKHLAARESYEAALAELLEVVRRDRGFEDGAARRAMLDVFEILGHRHPLTERYRDELARVLFS